MSTVEEHLAALRRAADAAGHGNRMNSRDFQFHANLLCGVHLEELERMVHDSLPPGRIKDTEMKALTDGNPALASLGYDAAYKIIGYIEAAAIAAWNRRSPAGAPAVLLLTQKATEWWESKRPLSWDEKAHRQGPTVNCMTDAERALALAFVAVHQAPPRNDQDCREGSDSSNAAPGDGGSAQ